MLKKTMYSEDYLSIGLLVLRIGIGLSFIAHGYPKVFAGGAEHLAGALAKAGIPGGIVAAYLAGLAEFLGGFALIAGVLFRPASVILAFTMAVALSFHLSFGDPFLKYSHALESLVLFIALAFTGPGRWSVDYRWFGNPEEMGYASSGFSKQVCTPSPAEGR